MRILRFLASACAASWISIAWSHSGHQAVQFNALDITNSRCCGDVHLTDDAGRVRTLSDFRGKVVVLAFGYTHCPDVCPTTLSELAKVRRDLGAKGKDVQVLFVTLDPERDTGPVLRQFVNAFDPSFVPLRGSKKEIARVAEDFRIIFDKDPANSEGTYSVYHMSGTYVFDRSGKPRLFVSAEKPELMVKDLRLLLR